MSNLLPFEKFVRDIEVKEDATTNSAYGQNPNLRSVNELIKFGIVNIDKPSGPSSHQVSAYVKHILGNNKTGHSGTLDPKVTGVLPVALGTATRIVQVLLPAGKEYVCLMQLHKDVDFEKLKKVCDTFVGKIKQLPPVKSSVVRKVRERKVYYLEIIELDGRNALFRVGCQAGTYIRKLVSDIGSKIGGAHMLELRRTKAGPFKEANSSTLQDLVDAFHYYQKDGNDIPIRKIILPIEAAVEHLPKMWAFDSAIASVCQGTSLKVPGVCKLHSGIKKGELVALMSLKDELVCYGTAGADSSIILKGSKGLALKPDAVFMKKEAYHGAKD